MKLPDKLIKTLTNVHDDAQGWLSDFPTYLNKLETEWNVRSTGLVEDLSFNVVMFATGKNGTDYILKLSPPGEDLSREAAALQAYDGDGINQLVKADLEGGALLLERLHPGVSFWRTTDDELATRTCAALLLKLWRPVQDEQFRSLKSWCRALPAYLDYPKGEGFLPHKLVDKASGLLTDLLQTDERVLLHADLHHGNILSAARAPFLAIDPKGIVGAKGFDIPAFLGNPHGVTERPDFRGVLERRMSIFSEMLGFSTEAIAAWGLAHSMLNACWAGGNSAAVDVRLARMFDEYL